VLCSNNALICLHHFPLYQPFRLAQTRPFARRVLACTQLPDLDALCFFASPLIGGTSFRCSNIPRSKETPSCLSTKPESFDYAAILRYTGDVQVRDTVALDDSYVSQSLTVLLRVSGRAPARLQTCIKSLSFPNYLSTR
jgi:hypothetical protein